VVLKVNGNEVASGVVPVSAPLGFTANDCLDFGIDLGSPVGLEVLRSGAVQVQRHDRRRTCGIHRLPRAVTAGENANRWTDASSGLNRLLRRRNSGRTPHPRLPFVAHRARYCAGALMSAFGVLRTSCHDIAMAAPSRAGISALCTVNHRIPRWCSGARRRSEIGRPALHGGAAARAVRRMKIISEC
jgi:hypothetical protein